MYMHAPFELCSLHIISFELQIAQFLLSLVADGKFHFYVFIIELMTTLFKFQR
jgi:hypothetical protein